MAATRNSELNEFEVDAFLADSVDGANGKLYALGAGWNVITASQFPVRQPRIGIAIVIRVPYNATNQQHTVEVSLLGDDGALIGLADNPADSEQRITKLVASFNIGRPPLITPGDSQVVPIALNIDGLLFENPGGFCFVVEIDGTVVKRLPLRLLAKEPQLLPKLG